jgi:Flp pilus assembly protein TadD
VLATNPEASVRNGSEAVELAARAVKLSGAKDPAILDTLAAAYAEAGRFPEAVETARQALTLATEPLAAELKARIALYEDKRAFRDTQ